MVSRPIDVISYQQFTYSIRVEVDKVFTYSTTCHLTFELHLMLHIKVIQFIDILINLFVNLLDTPFALLSR